MKKFTYKPKSELKPIDTLYYDALIDKNVVNEVPLIHSREVKLASTSRRTSSAKRLGVEGGVFASNETSQSMLSARKKDGRLLDKGIQLYRLWFNFLKLALELEELKVELVIKQHNNNIKDHTNPDIPRSVVEKSKKISTSDALGSGGDSGTNAIYKSKVTQRIKVKRSAYKGWDLDRVLTEDFNTWWNTHSHLFEGYYPAIIRDKKDWVDNQDFIYLRIDKNSQIRDVNKFYDEEIKPQLNSKVSNKFKILGKNARSNVIQNNFNALVLSLKGWTGKEICTHKNIYLRKTDEVDGNNRTVGERLTVSKDKSGKPLYSQRVSIQKDLGIHHLLEVCEGRFGLSKGK